MASVIIKTSGGHTYAAMYAGISLNGCFKAQIYDTRRLPAIAAELDAQARLEVYNDASGETPSEIFEGYTKLIRIESVDAETTMIMLDKEAADAPEI